MNINKAIEVSQQTLDSVFLSADALISSVDSSTFMLIYDDDVQKILGNTNINNYINNNANANANGPLALRLNECLRQNPNISSINIITVNNFDYSGYNSQQYSVNTNYITNTDIYKEASNKGISYIVKLNANGILSLTSGNKNENYISVIRTVSSIDTFKPLALSIVNIDTNTLSDSISDISNKYGMDVLIRDSDNNQIIGFKGTYNFSFDSLIRKAESKDFFSSLININKKNYIFSSFKSEKYKWFIIGLIPTATTSKDSNKFYFINILILIINSLIAFFLGSFILSRIITRPIKKLIKSMKSSENGDFKIVTVNTGSDEIGELKAGYNRMISQIQLLIENIVEEQKLKRKYELNVLHEQIKPHFLYNTFDSISSLALSAGNEEIYSIMCALGSFYKNSLSKGSEIITIDKEVEIVKNYLFIQSYRYKDLFSVEYNIDDEVLDYKILKLVLQPLVENSIYHGIKLKGEKGNIIISAYYSDGNIYLKVEDDGVGMDENLIKSILTGDSYKYRKSFGITGTLERLKLFYDTDDVLSIKSKIGQGTIVTIKIPAKKEE